METLPEEREEIPDCVQQSMKKIVTTIDQDLLSLDTTFDDTKDRRNVVITKMSKVIDKLNISLDGDPETIEAQARFLDTYGKFLNDQENNLYRRVSVKLKKHEAEQQNDISAGVTKILQNIQLGGQQVMPTFELTDEERNRLMEHEFEDRGCVVIATTELENDANNVHELSAVLREEAKNAGMGNGD